MNYTELLTNRDKEYSADNYSAALINIIKDIAEPKTGFKEEISHSIFDFSEFIFIYSAKHSDFDYATAYHDYLVSQSNKIQPNISRHGFSSFCSQNLALYTKRREAET